MSDSSNPSKITTSPPVVPGAVTETPANEAAPPGSPEEPTVLQPPSLPSADSRPGSGLSGVNNPNLPGYEILGIIDRGGMGVVFKARQVSINRLVALKMIRSGEYAGTQELVRFQVEAQAVARLDHPHIVRIYDFGEQNGLPYFSMELVEGGSLEKKLATGPLAARDAAALVETLAWAIHFVHQQHIVHRDLKPANVLLAADGTPKVADFGLAKRLDGDLGLTMTKTVMGTASYMAPEQAAGKAREVGPATDVYSLGAILYESLTGQPPFRAETRELTILQVLSDDPAPPSRHRPEIPRDLETICLKCLEKEPGRRYPSALALAEDLRRFLAGEPISIATTTEWDRHARWAKRAGYELLDLLGCGRTGFVYKARQLSLNRLVTLKLLLVKSQPDPAQMARFRQEAEAVARLHHSNIVQVYDLGEQHGQTYLVLEFVDGVSLREKYVDTPMPARAAAELVETLARTLHYAHQQGIVHCGLKPGCVLLSTEGVPKVTRFGLARLLGQMSDEAEEKEAARRAPSYLAPEQIDGQPQAIVPTVDVYGLGAILYKLLTGQPPFLGDSLQATREQVLTQEPMPPGRLRADVPHDLEAICLKCLRKDPGQRYPSAEALAKDLQRFLAGEHVRGDTAASARAGRLAVPGYAISGELGRGGLGVVYKAFQASHKRIVALKMILAGPHLEPAQVVRIRQAAEAMARLDHPNVVRIFEVGEQSGCPYIAMELVSAGSLARKLAGSPMPFRKAAHLVESLARTLHQVHQQGLVHGNLKTANVFLTPKGIAKLTDFGMAGAIGTPAYLAPEQMEAPEEPTPATDIYGLGVILYELLTARPPFRAVTASDTVRQILEREPESLLRVQPTIPLELEAICLKCLHKDPGQRPPSAEVLAEDLRRFLAGKGVAHRLLGVWKQIVLWLKGRGPNPG